MSLSTEIAGLTDHLDKLTVDGLSLLYRWEVCRERPGDMIKADTVTLTLLSKQEGVWRFSRMFGAISKGQYGRVLSFSKGNVKITKGRRKGAIVKPSSVTEDEHFKQSGKYKILRYGEAPSDCHEGRGPDIILVRSLLTASVYAFNPYLRMPGRLHMTFREDDYVDALRVKAETPEIHTLMQTGLYDDNLQIADNIRNCSEHFKKEMPETHRVAFPFSLYDGNGVLAFEDNRAWQDFRAQALSNSLWHSTTTVESLPHTEVFL